MNGQFRANRKLNVGFEVISRTSLPGRTLPDDVRQLTFGSIVPKAALAGFAKLTLKNVELGHLRGFSRRSP